MRVAKPAGFKGFLPSPAIACTPAVDSLVRPAVSKLQSFESSQFLGLIDDQVSMFACGGFFECGEPVIGDKDAAGFRNTKVGVFRADSVEHAREIGITAMRLIHTLASVTVIFFSSIDVSAGDTFQPLDTRTRCIVLFRECLVLIDHKDIDGIFEIIADGGASDFKLYPDPDSLSPELKQERQDVDRFIERNFRSASLLNHSFYKIQFSDLATAEEMVTVINTANNRKADAKPHSMKIRVKIPDKDRHESVELRFLETAEDIYWIPIGW